MKPDMSSEPYKSSELDNSGEPDISGESVFRQALYSTVTRPKRFYGKRRTKNGKASKTKGMAQCRHSSWHVGWGSPYCLPINWRISI